MPNSCKVCGKEDSKKCGQCHRVYYCSVQCQKKDWKSHKATCSPRQPAETQNPLLRVRDKPMHDKTQAKPVFGEPFTLEKFIPHVEKIKENTKNVHSRGLAYEKLGKWTWIPHLQPVFASSRAKDGSGSTWCAWRGLHRSIFCSKLSISLKLTPSAFLWRCGTEILTRWLSWKKEYY